MSTRKHVPHKTPVAATAELSGDEVDKLPSGNLGQVEVTSLELDEQFEVDTDPYNRTGSHCVAALRRKDS